jgi:hypothetical protein
MTEQPDATAAGNRESDRAEPDPAPSTTASAAVPEQGVGPDEKPKKQRVVRVRRRRAPVELTFQPVANGVDYLLSVTEHLAGTPTPRDLKYAVLHLQAATEVLLKSCLLTEHWSLVFDTLENANREAFDKGDFKSCGTDQAVKRLKNIAAIDLGITPSIQQDLNRLRNWRNALQHFGLTVPAPAVEKLAANILDFLLVFVGDQLRDALPIKDRNALDRDMEAVSEGLAPINRFLANRMNRLAEELKSRLDDTVRCPLCRQDALVVEDSLTCRFCQIVWQDGGDVAAVYVENVQGHDTYSHYKDGGDALITECPECKSEALVSDVEMASGQTVDHFCFSCGTQYGPLGTCDSCGSPTTADGGLSLCGTCLDSKLERF